MTSEKSQIKFAKSERTGELIGFVYRHPKTPQLKGVRVFVLSAKDTFTEPLLRYHLIFDKIEGMAEGYKTVGLKNHYI